jgi:hypothetical protein
MAEVEFTGEADDRRTGTAARALLELFTLGLPLGALIFYHTAGEPSRLHAPVTRNFAPLYLVYGFALAGVVGGRLRQRRSPEGASVSARAWLVLAAGLPAAVLATWELASPRPHEGIRHGLLVVSMLPALTLVCCVHAPRAAERSLQPASALLVLISISLVVLGVEIAWQIVGEPSPQGMPSISNADRSYWTYRPGSTSELHGVRHRFNSWGLRGPEPGSFESGSGALRVLVLGDSIPFGGGLPEPQVFPWLAEKRIRERGRIPRPVEIVNASLPGYGTEQIRNLYLQHLADLPHDWVVLVQYVDDVNRELKYKKDDRIYTPSWPEWMQDSYHRVRIWRAVLTLLGFGEKDFQLYRRRTREEAWPAAIGFIEEIRDEVERRGARFAIFDVPRFKWRSRLESVEDYAFIALDRELEAYCRERGVPYRSVLPALAGRDIRPLRMSAGDIHFNRSGHALVADEFASFVETILREDG